MPNAHLEVQRTDTTVTWTINRPHRRNALHEALWDSLRSEAQALATDPPRALIITGAEGHFCSGMDLSMDNPLCQQLLVPVAQKNPAPIEDLIQRLKGVFEAIRDIGCPVIAAIEGACAGGGLELALACDLRVAARTAFFALPETRWGMVPDVGGSVRLTRLIGPARASDLILTGRSISSETASQWGLVDRLSETGEALTHSYALAEQIAVCAPKANRHALRVIRNVHGMSDTDAFTLETLAGASAILSGEVVEGLAAFVEKRPPRWDA